MDSWTRLAREAFLHPELLFHECWVYPGFFLKVNCLVSIIFPTLTKTRHIKWMLYAVRLCLFRKKRLIKQGCLTKSILCMERTLTCVFALIKVDMIFTITPE